MEGESMQKEVRLPKTPDKTITADKIDLGFLMERLRKEIIEKENYLSEVACGSDELERHSDPTDKATKQNLHTTNGALFKRYIERLRELNEAFVRFADGTFGICEKCSEPIGAKRLEVMPATTMCIDCAQEEEDKKLRN